MPAATFEAAAFKLGEKRTILFHQAERNLGKVVRVAAGNLKVQQDFRSVHATILENWLGVDSVSVLGGEHPKLSFFS